MKTPQKIFNADDFGLNRNVNDAVIKAFKDGVLNSTSLMVSAPEAEKAAGFLRKNTKLSGGVHLVLTKETGVMPLSPPSEIPLLTDKNGRFKHGFIALLLLSEFKWKQFVREAELEMRRQIEKMISMGLAPSHLDSHRHIHMIPELFKIALKLQKEYEIPRIRIVNESLIKTLSLPKDFYFLRDGGLVKYMVLKTMYYQNKTKGNVYFYSILHAMRLFGDNVRKIDVPKGYDAVEIGIHPAFFESDRIKELETLLDKNLPLRIEFGTD